MSYSQFIQQESLALLNSLTDDAIPRWGLMQAQHMVEHLGMFFRLSQKPMPLSSRPPEYLEKSRAFLFSNQPFPLNVKIPHLMEPEVLPPFRYTSLNIAKNKLRGQIEAFYRKFEDEPNFKNSHPIFGELDFEGWQVFHYKHVRHHLAQFDLIDAPEYAPLIEAHTQKIS
ncbi:DUF1569 domain-containing protein [Pontibacter sp. G13]|uniref:DUF1569 domain-containing protein n=1 Tax=Pontibacter sp. G13 TaxID=3074898 RepID=UPI00288C4B1D|nr:DUF1569 domain-containing protein [Pontibacter sp. G13]WNJ19633.1 DUF1569 domain-containing protein [Pontibacter sp. G13]